ncbi:MAG: GerMN domain-containing protein [Actinomycetota bacterium]
MYRTTVRAAMLAALLSLFLLSGLCVWGCDKVEPPAAPEEEETAADGGGTSGDSVTVTLYFRRPSGNQDWLYPTQTTVIGATDPYLTAMEQLIKGPAEGTQLYPVLPDTVKVLDIDVAGGICTVNVSKEILTDANQVGVSASGEGLALAAIADTLTEFEDVDRVALFIEGLQSGMIEGRFVEDFWGHMGLPAFLERNEEVIYSGP